MHRDAVSHAAEGLRFWKKITDTAVITVGPRTVRDLKRLRDMVPEIRYIPSFSCASVLNPTGFDSPEGWSQLAQFCGQMRVYTGCKVVLLETELAIKPFVEGRHVMNWDGLREGLRKLPKDMRVLWYPSSSNNDVVRARYLRLCRVVQEELPMVMFVDHLSLEMPGSNCRHAKVRQSMQELESIARLPQVPILYCCGDVWWPFDRVPEAMRLTKSDWVLLNTGYDRWIDAARDLSERLRPLVETGRSRAEWFAESQPVVE